MSKEKTLQEQAAEPYRCFALDFDGCLCSDAYPDIGAPNMQVINAAKARIDQGWECILWTCREGWQLAEAVGWCKAHGLIFHAINTNTDYNKQRYGGECRKVFADEYWDDRSITVAAGRVHRGLLGGVR